MTKSRSVNWMSTLDGREANRASLQRQLLTGKQNITQLNFWVIA